MSEPLLDGVVGLVFPGQGSQFVGMASQLANSSPAARARIAEADEVLGFRLSTLMFDGPADVLEDTINAQPALLAAGVAAVSAIEEGCNRIDRSFTPIVGAGHSLGEFTALVAAGALDYGAALTLVRERGRLMKEAGDASPGGMAAILGVEDQDLADICSRASDAGTIVIANANCPGQTVISGEVAALEKAMILAKEAGAKRALRLGVSIAAHSPLMAEANRQFADAINALEIAPPRWPVISNADVRMLRTPDDIRHELLAHMEGPVLWTQTVKAMQSVGVDTIVEAGPGAVLAGLIKRIDRNLTVKSVGDLGLDLPVDAA